jgi:alpha-tubulin suppressor-like RCC1 family protein
MRTLIFPMFSLTLVGCFLVPPSLRKPPSAGNDSAFPSQGTPEPEKQEPAMEKPADVDSTRLRIGGERVCLTKGGRGYCVGPNRQLELGDGTTETRGAPTEPAKGAFSNVWAIGATEMGFSCLLDGGKAICWGEYTKPQTAAPRAVVKRSTWMAAGAGAYCFVHDGGKVHCVENGVDESFEVQGITNAARIALSQYPLDTQGCAVLTTGKVSCWGGKNEFGSLGRGFAGPPSSGAALSEAVEVLGLDDVQDVAGHNGSWCAIKKNGELWCWGSNEFDRFGVDDDKTKQVLQPMKVALPAITDVALNGTALCAVQRDGKVSCFGFGSKDIFPQGDKWPKTGKVWPGAKIEGPSEIDSDGSMMCILGGGDKVTCFGKSRELGVSEGSPKEFQF